MEHTTLIFYRKTTLLGQKFCNNISHNKYLCEEMGQKGNQSSELWEKGNQSSTRSFSSSTCKDLSVKEQNFASRVVGKIGRDAEGELNMEMIPKPEREAERCHCNHTGFKMGWLPAGGCDQDSIQPNKLLLDLLWKV